MSVMKKVFNSEIKSIDEKEFTLTAYISTGARDRMNESLDPTGIDMSNYRKNPVVLWAHDYSLPPIGKAMWVKKDGEGILSKVKFASTAFAQEIFQLYKEGFLKAFSVGFVPKEQEDGDGDKKPRRTYKKWELLEYSAVPVPANPEALALAMQKGIIKTESLKAEMEKGLDPDDDKWDEDEPKESKEEAVEEVEVKPLVINPALDELMAENKLLKEQIDSMNKEMTELKYKLYQLTEKIKVPEITVDDLANKVVEIVNGVIRKSQGKLN